MNSLSRTPPARLVTRREAATYLRITPEAFGLWIKRGIVPGRVPGTYRYDLAAIEAALDKASGLGSTGGDNAPA